MPEAPLPPPFVHPDRYALHGEEGAELARCHVELYPDGTVGLVVDGERLFRFASVEALLTHYDVTKGQPTVETLDSANAELGAAELAAAAWVAAIHLRPRAEKTAIDAHVVAAIQRVRSARARLATLRDPTP